MLTDFDNYIHRFSSCMLHTDGQTTVYIDRRGEYSRRILAPLRMTKLDKRKTQVL
jgi:hypothetical protein